MAITPSDIYARFPGQFDALGDDVLNLIISEVNLEIDEEHWGTPDFDIGATYLTAHIATYTTPGGGGSGSGATGPLIKHKVGDVELSFGAGAVSAAMSDLGATPYGARFLSLRRWKQPGIAFVS